MIQQAQNVTKIPASALKFWPPQDYLDKTMKEYPDSVNKFLQRLIEFRKRMTGQRGPGTYANAGNAGGQGGSGGTGRAPNQGGFSAGGGQGQNGQNSDARRSGRSRFGLVWVRTLDNKLMPHRVTTGLSDGSYTAIESNLKEGDEVVVGIINTQTSTTTTQTQQSPFQPQMPRPGAAGGRGGR
jgi:hypothetical protein